MMQLRDYQRRAIDGLYRYFEHNNGNPLIVAPTGSGKSVIIGALCKEILDQWPDQRVMILSHVKELLEQNFAKITSFWPKAPAGLYSAGLGARQSRDPITVASIQSVYRKPHIFGWRDLVVIDEAHLLSNDSDTMYQQFIDGLRKINPRLKVVGLTATPYRLKSGMLHEGKLRLFTDVAVEISMRELMEAGHLCPLASKSSVVQADLSGVSLVAGEFNARESEAAMDKEALTTAALDEVFELASDRHSWLFFCSGVGHAQHVADALRERGVTAATVTGETPDDERDAILREFKAGSIRAVTNANVLTTGFDAPNIDLLVLLRPTTSPGLYVQIMGRGMRTHPTKRNCLVLDFAGNVERFGCVDQIRPPRVAAQRGKRDTHERSCLICPQCRMASPLGSLECRDCGHSFQRPEVIRHGVTASLAQVMSGDEPPPEHLGDWFTVDRVEYHRHEKDGKTPTLRVEYVCGVNRFKEWVCLEHPPGFARGKAVDWWKKRYDGTTIPDSIELAIYFSDVLRRPIRIRTRMEDKYWRITGYDFTGWSLKDEPAPEAGNTVSVGNAEPLYFGDT